MALAGSTFAAFFDHQLETVRRFQRPEAMQCQGLVEAFMIPILQLALQLPERSHGLVVFRPVVRPLEALPPQLAR